MAVLDGINLLIETSRQTHQHVASLMKAGATQEELERDLQALWQDGNQAVRIALRRANEAIAAAGYRPVIYEQQA